MELRCSVYSQASAIGGTFNICQCSIVVWIVAKVEIQISQSSTEVGNLFGAITLHISNWDTSMSSQPGGIIPPVREGDFLDGPEWSGITLILIVIAAYSNSLTHLQG